MHLIKEFVMRLICCCALVLLSGYNVVVSGCSLARLVMLVKLSLWNLVRNAFMCSLGADIKGGGGLVCVVGALPIREFEGSRRVTEK